MAIDPLFLSLTRPQLLFGVPYGFVVINGIITTEFFIIFNSLWVFLIAFSIHLIGVVITLRDAHMIDVWLTKVRKCPRVPNYSVWRCNSYRP